MFMTLEHIFVNGLALIREGEILNSGKKFVNKIIFLVVELSMMKVPTAT